MAVKWKISTRVRFFLLFFRCVCVCVFFFYLRVAGHVLDEDAPLAVGVAGPHGPAVDDVGRAQVAGAAEPGAAVVGAAGVAVVVGGRLLQRRDAALHRVLGRLVGQLGVLFHRVAVLLQRFLCKRNTHPVELNRFHYDHTILEMD